LKKAWKDKYLEQIKRVNKLANFVYVRQPYPLWDGDAILRVKNLIQDEPFLVLFWDDIVDWDKTAAEQLLEAFKRKNSSIIATIKVSDEEVRSYWIIETKEVSNIFTVSKFLEKPDPQETKSRNWVIWKYILTPDIFDYLEKAKTNKISKDWELRLADALELMRQDKDIYWLNIKGERFDTWNKLWYIKAVIHYALKNPDLSKELKDYLSLLKITEWKK
jgi:UTP--glucose-1-phosphate uridylyltransferase